MYMYTYHKYFTKCLKIRCCKSKKDCQYKDNRKNYYLQSKKIPYNDKKKNDKGQTRIYNRRTDNTMTKRKMTKDKQGCIIEEQTIQWQNEQWKRTNKDHLWKLVGGTSDAPEELANLVSHQTDVNSDSDIRLFRLIPSLWFTTYLLSLVTCFSTDSRLTCSFIRMRQNSYRGFPRKKLKEASPIL